METSVDTLVTPSEFTEPLLASQLIDDEELDDLVDSVLDASISKRKDKKDRLKTGVKTVDDALGGGLESARVVCVSGEAAAGANEVSKNRQHGHVHTCLSTTKK